MIASELLHNNQGEPFPRGIVPILEVIAESPEDIRAVVKKKALFSGDLSLMRNSELLERHLNDFLI